MLWKRCTRVDAYRVKNSFCCDIKCTRGTISGIDPINYPLPMSILIMIHFTICITEGIPVLSHGKIRFTCIYVVLYITTPKSSHKALRSKILKALKDLRNSSMMRTMRSFSRINFCGIKNVERSRCVSTIKTLVSSTLKRLFVGKGIKFLAFSWRMILGKLIRKYLNKRPTSTSKNCFLMRVSFPKANKT